MVELDLMPAFIAKTELSYLSAELAFGHRDGKQGQALIDAQVLIGLRYSCRMVPHQVHSLFSTFTSPRPSRARAVRQP